MNEMLRYDIINKLIKKINAKTYLEIGLDSGGNFIKIECEKVVSSSSVIKNENPKKQISNLQRLLNR